MCDASVEIDGRILEVYGTWEKPDYGDRYTPPTIGGFYIDKVFYKGKNITYAITERLSECITEEIERRN